MSGNCDSPFCSCICLLLWGRMEVCEGSVQAEEIIGKAVMGGVKYGTSALLHLCHYHGCDMLVFHFFPT